MKLPSVGRNAARLGFRLPAFHWNVADQLSQKYLLVTLVLFAAIGLPAYSYLEKAVEQQFVHNYSDFAMHTAARIFTQHLETVDGGAYTEPLTGKSLEVFQTDVQNEVASRDLRKLKVWRPDGMLLYSTDGTGVGETRALDGGLLEAIEHGVKAEVEEDEAEVAGEQSGGRVLEIYLPVRNEQGRVINVFEIYYGLTPLTAAISSMRVMMLVFLLVLFSVTATTALLGARLLVHRNRQLLDLTGRLERLAITDGLTGIWNHRYFREQLDDVIERSRRAGGRFSLIMVDLDFFKQVNDTYGHQTGDLVLKGSAALMAECVRSGDIVARYGGEEFAILLPRASEAEAVGVANRLREAIRGMAVAAGGANVSITASFGIAEFPSAARDAESVISAADSALYFSKKHGRDQVCAFSALGSQSFDQDDVDHLFHRLRHASRFTIQALTAALLGSRAMGSGKSEARDGDSSAIPGLSDDERERLALVASIHEANQRLGGNSSGEGELTPHEFAVISGHPEAAEQVMRAIAELERVLSALRQHPGELGTIAEIAPLPAPGGQADR